MAGYTGLGVGNRHGILAMLLGAIMIVMGTFFAFYIKPVLIRRHKERVAMKRADRSDAGRQVPLKEAVTGLLLLSVATLVGCGGGDRAAGAEDRGRRQTRWPAQWCPLPPPRGRCRRSRWRS